MPKNMADLEIYEIEELQVNEYHPLPDGMGPPTEVHLALKMKHAPDNMLLIMRLKSRRACDELMAAIKTHTDSVFPETGADPDVDFAEKKVGKS